MANRLFQVFGEVVLRKRGVDEGLRETQQAAQQTERSFRQMGEGADQAGQKAEGLTQRFSVLQELISKVFIPVLIARQITQMITEFEKLRAKIDELDDTFRSASIAFQRGFLGEARSDSLGDLETALRGVQDQAAAAKQQISDSAEAEAALLRQASLAKQVQNAIAGVTEESIRSRAATQIAVIETAARREEERIRKRAALEQELENRAALQRAQRAREEVLEAGRLHREQQEKERIDREIAHGDQVAQAEQNHRDELDRIQERHMKELELDRKRHQERLRQIEREAAAATRASAQVALQLGVAPGNAGRALEEINSKTQKPTIRIRTTRGGG